MPTFNYLQKLRKNNRVPSRPHSEQDVTRCVPMETDPYCDDFVATPAPEPEPTPLLTLYYRVFTDDSNDVQNAASSMDIFSSPFPGPACSIRALSDQSGKQIKDGNKNSILWDGLRLAVTHPENTTISNAVYQERFVINNNDNSISGIAVYEDSGSGVTTSVSKNTFMVTGAIGEACVGATRCIIEYDNKGNASWNTSEVKYMRRLQFF